MLFFVSRYYIRIAVLKFKPERASYSDRTVHAEIELVHFKHTFYDGQSKTASFLCTLVCFSVFFDAVISVPDVFKVFRVDAYTAVTDFKTHGFRRLMVEIDFYRLIVACISQCVVYEVVYYLIDLCDIGA